MKIRIGYGYDVHKLVEGREFWLGGIKIDSEYGAFGHSDADVLLHAIIDAMLGAANLRDIGFQYPDTDPNYKGVDSKELLRDAFQKIKDKGYKIGNIDSTIILQSPKISSYIPRMIEEVSTILDLDQEDVSIKASTSERLGFLGREEGVAAHAVILLIKK